MLHFHLKMQQDALAASGGACNAFPDPLDGFIGQGRGPQWGNWTEGKGKGGKGKVKVMEG